MRNLTWNAETSVQPAIRVGLRLDVDIGGFDIELSSMPKQTSIGNELQYQICCLDASEIASWN